MRTQIDLFLLGLARAAANLWFRTVQVVGGHRLPSDGPTLVVASHFNGILDPVLVAQSSARMPRFLAAATFWRNPLAARLLDMVGALPVSRSGEGDTSRNRRIFEACEQALRDGELIALFPEGLTHDQPKVGELRTGAARIALGARESGVRGVKIVPVGLVYSSKQRPRSRALVRIGEPIDLDRDLDAITAGVDPDDPKALARALTEEIRERLAAAALDYENGDVALAAAHAARIALRPRGSSRTYEPPMHDLERAARSIAAAPVVEQRAVVDALRLYADELALLGIDDADLVAGDLTPAVLRWHLGRLAGFALAAPAAGVGLAVNGPAVAMVWAAGLLPVSTPMRATVRLLTGLGLLPASWVLLRVQLGRREGLREPTLLTILAGPGCGLIALWTFERVAALGTARLSFQRLREHAAVVPALESARTGVVDAVAHALAATDDADLLDRQEPAAPRSALDA